MKHVSIRQCARCGLNEAVADIIAGCVCEFTGYTLEQLRGHGRVETRTTSRMVLCYLLSELLHASVVRIGVYMNCQHGSVINALRRVPDLMSVDSVLKAEVEAIRAMCVDRLSKAGWPIPPQP